MSFFYDLNKKLDSIRATPEVTHKQLNERDMSRAAKGIEKYGKDGMQALAKAGREGKDLDKIRDKYNKYDDKKDVDEGVMDTIKSVGKKVAGGINKLVGHGSDEEMIKDLQRKSGAPVTGKKPEQRSMREAAGPLDFDKVLDAIAALYGDDIWDNDAMQDLAHDLEQAGPTDRELDFIIAKGRLPKRLAGTQFSAGDSVRFGESGAPMTSKQKSFAKLAPPADKITFADKIAGAKKEVDEMLGDVAAEAMRSALGGGKGRNAGMEEGSDENAFTAHKRPSPVQPKVGSTERGHKHDIKHTATGRIVTRRTDDQGISVGGETDDEGNKKEKRTKAGRPEGSKNVSSRAKVFQRKSKLMTKESDVDVTDQGEYDQEGDMAKNDIKTIVRHAEALHKILGDDDNLPEWVQSKLAKIEGMMISIDEYMQNQEDGDDGEDQDLDERHLKPEEKRKKEQVFKKDMKPKMADFKKRYGEKGENVAHAVATNIAKGVKMGKKKNKEEEVEESSTTAGSVAPSTATTGSKGGVFGKGIYDSMNFELEQMIAESMQNEDAPRSWQRAADKVGTIGGAALGAAGGGAAGALMGTSVFGPLGIGAAAVGGLAGLTGGAAFGSKLAKSAVNTAHDAGVGLYRKISSMLGGPEGTIAFAKAHIKAAASGQDSFEFGGKNYNVTMNRGEATQLERNLSYKDNMGRYDQLGYPVRKGVPLNRGLTRESMSVNMSDSTEGNKSLTVTATDDDAMKLAMMLKSAGLGGQGRELQSDESCSTCGMPDCGCGDVQEAVDENAPDYPTNTQQAENNFGYEGGLNKPKTDVAGDGQTTIPNTAVHTQDEDALRRMMEMAGLAEGNMPMVKKDGKMVPAFAADGKGKNDLESKDKEEDTVEESIRRMMEIAGVKKKPVDEEKTEEGNLFTKGLEDDDVKIGDKIPGTNAIKKKDIDESIFALTNQWQAYKG